MLSGTIPDLRHGHRTKIQQLSVEEAVASLRSATDGLSSSEARRRLAEFGANQLEPPRKPPLFLRLVRQFFPFFSVILWIAAGLGFLGEWYDPGQGMMRVSLAIIAVILVSGLF